MSSKKTAEREFKILAFNGIEILFWIMANQPYLYLVKAIDSTFITSAYDILADMESKVKERLDQHY